MSRWQAPHRETALAFVGLLGVALSLFPEAVLGRRFFFERDVHLVWHAQVESFVRAVTAGSWPLWDPCVSFGQPMLANANMQVFYPLTWLNLLMRPAPVYTVLVVTHVLLAGVGLYLLARRLGLGGGGAFLAAAAGTTCGPFVSLVNVWHHLSGAAWIPWVFLAADRALASHRARDAVLWGAALAVQLLAGSPDMSAFTGAAVAAYALTHVEWRRPLDASNRRLLFTVSVALLFSLGLSAAQWAPSLEVARRSLRWDVGADLRAVGSVNPAVALVKVLSPVPLVQIPLRGGYGVAVLDSGMPFLLSLYLGVPALGLALAALVGPPRRGRLFFAALAAVAFLVALGRHSFVHEAAVTLFLPLRALRYPAKAMVLVGFATALLAGMGWENFRRPDRFRRHAVLIPVLLGALALATAAVVTLARARPDVLGEMLVSETELGTFWAQALGGAEARVVSAALLWAAAASAALVRWRLPQHASHAASLFAVLAIADLALSARAVNRTVPREFYLYRPPFVDAVDQRDFSRLLVHSYPLNRPLTAVENPYRIAWYPSGLSFDAGRALAVRLYMMPPVAAVWDLFTSYDPDLLGLFPRPLQDLVSWTLQAEGTPAYRRLLELGAVKWVEALHERGLEELVFTRELPSPLARPVRLYRVPHPLPRTYVVGGSRVADGPAALTVLLDPAFDPEREVLLASGPATRGAPDFSGTSRILEFRPDRVRLEAALSRAGFLVLVDAYDPGWRASVDGRAVELLRANVAFRAVRLSEGVHRIELAYQPRAVALGLGASLMTLLGAAAVLGRRQAPPTASPEPEPAAPARA